jgi:two-component system, cell cycle sensor histidine kinase and response regulator CckA
MKDAEPGFEMDSEGRYRAIVEEMPALVCQFLPDGTLTFANTHYCRYFNVEYEDLIGQNFFQFIPEEDRGQVRANYGSLTPENPVITYEHKVTAPDGTARWQRWTDRAIFDPHGKPLEYRSIGEDITGRKLAEEALQESNRLLEETLASLQEAQGQIIAQERLAAVGQLAGGIAHDFNNVLASISLYSELLAREPGLRPEAGEWIKTIHEQSRHAAGLTQQILDFSRRSLLKSRVLDLYELVEQFARKLQPLLPEGVKAHLSAGRGRLQVQGDPDRLEQALFNLAANAGEAMPGGGQLRFSLEEILVSPGDRPESLDLLEGKWILLTVEDNGTGILPEDAPHIFEPYFTTKATGESSGLGLSQVYGIVKQHGGHIEMQTRVGEGTVFRLYFPAAGVEVVGEEPATAGVEEGQKATILVVEDNRASRLALCEVLQVYQYRTLAAADGRAALEIYRQEKVDLVISDLVMPVMGGIELLQALHKVDPGVKMLIHTGYPLDPTARELVHQGVVDWVQKPVTIEKIIEVVERALEEN